MPHCLVILVLAGPVAFIVADKEILAVIAPSLALAPQIVLADTPSFYSSKRNPIVELSRSLRLASPLTMTSAARL